MYFGPYLVISGAISSKAIARPATNACPRWRMICQRYGIPGHRGCPVGSFQQRPEDFREGIGLTHKPQIGRMRAVDGSLVVVP